MTGSHATGAPGVTQAQILNFNRQLALALPAPDESWTPAEAPDIVQRNVRRLLANDLVEVVARHTNPKQKTHRYRTKPAVYEWIQTHIDPPRTWPCGHAGFRNIPDGGYACQRDDCDAEFNRETAQEVYWG